MIVYTTGPDNPDAPGCYGSALTFKADASECRTCQFAGACGPLSQERLASLRARLGIVEPTRRTFKAPVAKLAETTPGPTLTSDLPKKVEAELQRIERNGIIITTALKEGRNPFEAKRKPAFLFLTCHLLLGLKRGITRAELRHALQRKLNWTEGTAAAHATQAAQVLVAAGAAYDVDGILTLKR
jgi:hypothetical protein